MRLKFAVAVFGALTLSLAGCAAAPPEATSTLSMPPIPSEPPQSSPSMSQSPDPRLAEGAHNTGAAMGDCLVVAAGISSVLLAPLSFRGDEDPETMAKLEDQLHHLHGKVPDELKPHFVRAADAAESGPHGTGQFDEPAFREALQPIQEWLREHCSEPSR
ncbi:hypothetical protein ASH00_05850 [Arthrobacter sp. Soil782]|uniref:hypothetical protein n=1 Tax=Arthrobacter sp. Soil782 TaxID=1736410 RepID=UPI0007010B39|nr:hypothetical protein [Arthrobacter sp. Soil782]KRF09164.1 hypothetical protein ASH00_05850 [Arthrobacter sp. Soil782]